jgi:hypothetical protein
MGNTLVLEVPADVYEPLAQTAKEVGRTPEELAIEWLTATLRHDADDPVENFVGAFSSHVPNWADEHDKHLGLSLLLEMKGGEEDNN